MFGISLRRKLFVAAIAVASSLAVPGLAAATTAAGQTAANTPTRLSAAASPASVAPAGWGSCSQEGEGGPELDPNG